MFSINTIGVGGFGFTRSQREQDAWDVKAHQDSLTMHENADGTFSQRHASKAELGGYRQHWRAVMLAIAAYFGIVLFGYDTGLGGGVVSQQPFLDDMKIHGSAKHIADIKANIVSILQGGSFFGALGAAPMNNAIGRKKSLLVGCVIFMVGGILQTAGLHLNYQYAGRFLAGVGVGIESSVCPTYVAELAPAHMRGNITGLFQVCVVIGVALSYWVNYFTSISSSLKGTTAVWQIPVAMQLAPLAVMFAILPFIKESPRWLASKNRNAEALKNLAWVRNMSPDDSRVQAEFSEIVAAVEEEKAATAGASWVSEIRAKGNPKRFIIAMLMFVCQQWSGQNSINYYAPDIFKSIGITGSSASLLASGVYGLVKIVATALFMIFGVERAGRKKYFFFGALGMGLCLMMIGAIFKSHPPKVPKEGETLPVPPSGIGMAVLIYIFVIPYCFSWGGLVWVYISELFNTRTRAYGIAFANASQWLNNFALTRATPLMVVAMPNGGFFFFFFAMNMVNACFSLYIPETIKLSLEQMDIVFGAVTKEERIADFDAKQRADTRVDGGSISGGSYDGLDEEKYGAEHVERKV
ncbi:hypothetical protein NliqN6_6538 [Naganishia liquefaciens]|uniref:Major facilitator superfamily (MFS) profile domain-containing protein n=1 Tax=Naganishia liquefaciens TaxID=104408 RepID=A0A8H3TYS8_9TREE|nr:hypothetical protein NliqN6_6538 [Naganishia liquefaciens]